MSPRPRPLLLALVPFALALAAAASCFNPSYQNGFPCGTGGACPSGFTCAAGLNACFKDGDPVPDAGAADALVGMVTVTVLDSNGGVREPAVNRPVAFHGADGVVLAVVMTDSMGRAVFTQMPVGGMVTAGLVKDGLTAALETVVGVEPGDSIRMSGNFGRTETAPTASTMNVTVNNFSPPAGTTSYLVDVGCQSGPGTVNAGPQTVTATLPVTRRCVSAQNTANVIAQALGAADAPLGYAISTNVLINAGAATNVTFSGWDTDFYPLDVQVQNAPPGAAADSHRIEVRALADRGEEDYRIMPTSRFTFTGPGNPAPFSWKMPRGVFDNLVIDVHANLGGPPNFPTRIVQHSLATPFPAAQVVVDLGTFPPSPTTSALVDPGGAAFAVTWGFSETYTPDPAEFLFLIAAWSEPVGAADAGMDDDNQRFWIVLAPPSLASPFVFPTLPSAFDPWKPSSRATFEFTPVPAALIGRIDVLTSYKDVRNMLGPGVFGEDNLLPGQSYRLRVGGTFLFAD